jgi:hypothetical protein
MPYQISWHEEKRIIHQRLIGDFDMTDATQAAKATEEYLKQGIGPVHLVIDVSGMKSFPTNMTKIHSISTYLKDPNLGWVVLIGGNSLTNFVTQVISQVIKFRIAQRPNLEQAVAFLGTYDPTLNTKPRSNPESLTSA